MIRRCQVVLLLVALLLSGCARKDVIPARKMVSILHDMYLLDIQVRLDRDYNEMADTTSVYGAVLAEYGYDQDDFNNSIDYYLHHPMKYQDIYKEVHKRFEAEAVEEEELNPRDMKFD